MLNSDEEKLKKKETNLSESDRGEISVPAQRQTCKQCLMYKQSVLTQDAEHQCGRAERPFMTGLPTDNTKPIAADESG